MLGAFASTAEGTDNLSGIEVLKFSDGYHVLEGMSLQAAIDAASDGDTIYVQLSGADATISINADNDNADFEVLLATVTDVSDVQAITDHLTLAVA